MNLTKLRKDHFSQLTPLTLMTKPKGKKENKKSLDRS